MTDVETPAEPVVHTGASNIGNAFKARLEVEKVPHVEDVSAAFGKVLEGTPKEITLSQKTIEEAVAHCKATPNVEGVKAAFTTAVNQLGGIEDAAKMPLRSKIQEKTLLEGFAEKLGKATETVKDAGQAANDAGQAAKDLSFLERIKSAESWSVKNPAIVDEVKNFGVNKKSLAMRGGLITVALGTGLSGIRDLKGREANDNSGNVEYFPMKGVAKLGAAAGTLFAAACYKGKGPNIASA